jgi:hypothetical protein
MRRREFIAGLGSAAAVTRNWGQLPAGRRWGTTAGIDVDPIDGNIWAYERCGAATAGGGPVVWLVELTVGVTGLTRDAQAQQLLTLWAEFVDLMPLRRSTRCPVCPQRCRAA